MVEQKKIRVLEIIQQGKIGGGESHLLTLIGQMDRERFEPVVVALSDGEMIGRLRAMGVRSYVVASRLPFNPTVWGPLRKLLREEAIDLVHTHGARSLSNILFPARRLSIPVVHTVHGWSFHDHLPGWKRRARIAGERFLTGKAFVNIAVSESNARIGREKLGVFNGVVINNGVDLAQYSGRGGSGFRQEWAIPEDAVVISWVARFIHDKNPLALIRAFARLERQYPAARLVLVGDGPAREAAMALARELGVAEKVIFPGFRGDVPGILGETDIFCLPSIKEGLPVSLIEAMAMGNAVVATDVQGCHDVVTHGRDGLLAPLEDLENGLTTAIGELLGDAGRRAQLAAEARRTVERRFDAREMARAIERLYLQVLDQKNASIS
ncbi:MAG TPA: glycosyltransferase family 4 protein [Puia sp.]|nr:glycosyltransferase family 4 protein [Puia sp.]